MGLPGQAAIPAVATMFWGDGFYEWAAEGVDGKKSTAPDSYRVSTGVGRVRAKNCAESNRILVYHGVTYSLTPVEACHGYFKNVKCPTYGNIMNVSILRQSYRTSSNQAYLNAPSSTIISKSQPSKDLPWQLHATKHAPRSHLHLIYQCIS